jgi:hypothetical protein
MSSAERSCPSPPGAAGEDLFSDANKPRKDLEGEQSPRKDRVSSSRQRPCDTTDSMAEQSLEFERSGKTASALGFWKRESSRQRNGREGNEKKAAAAVTQRRCHRGEFFEGSIASRGLPSPPHQASVWKVAGGTKRGEPKIGSGMQQARDSRAEQTVVVVQNHKGGTGSSSWYLGAEARRQRRVGVDARKHVDGRDCVVGRTTNPAREGHCPRAEWGSEEEPRP